ncbi:MAG: transcriptional repressor LexA [Rhodospirillales bacterium]|uniref:LexA repressor n=2 Tax=root TaxID=1 RepID=A0A564WCI3_9PROT|nr:transcriptional repressor LexA [Rhodospirillales bacterium]MDG4603678.1 transcriptional repressor LexA [Defluviicoccus sp.]SUS05030.1 LexA repressor [uncultured Defluviicoccus sp.]VUX46001.1 LexA repressor [Candidatus Defluviicoccus seviourii]MDG4610091.1 transcriptional repressor LexA [Defluviicoccus sp.]
MLTRKQYELLIFVNKYLNEQGVSPSFDEMKDALGLRSKSGIHRLMMGLEERGFIRRLPHRARALEVLRLPDNVAPKPRGQNRREAPFAPNVIKGDFKPEVRAPAAPPPATGAVSLPCYGRIAAGTPIAALADHSRFFEVPAGLLSAGEHYTLEVEGDSMIEAGIFSGDTVIIQRTENAENGTIVVALVDNEEVTLKRIRRRGQSIALEPANPAYETRICGPDQVRVQGRLVGLIRRY